MSDVALPTFKPITNDDREALATVEQLARTIWPLCYSEMISAEQIDYMLNRMYVVSQLLADQNAGITYILAYNLEGTPIGFIGWGPAETPHTCKLHKLYLHPDHHNRGWGSAMLQHIEQTAAARNFKTLILTVNKINHRALAAYRRNHFTVQKSVCVDIGNGFVMDDYIMEKPLTPRP